MQILMTTEAHNDIDSIFEYISFDSIKHANETLKNIYSHITKLEHTPYLGRYVPKLPDKQYRELLYKSYRIIYTISKETNTIYIHFIIHNKRNFKSFFNSYINNKF